MHLAPGEIAGDILKRICVILPEGQKDKISTSLSVGEFPRIPHLEKEVKVMSCSQ